MNALTPDMLVIIGGLALFGLVMLYIIWPKPKARARCNAFHEDKASSLADFWN